MSTSNLQQPSGAKNWRKFVTVDPAAGIFFIMDKTEGKPIAHLTLKNMSDVPILYKVKTTNPVYYLVRPNQGIIQPNSDISVKVIFNF